MNVSTLHGTLELHDVRDTEKLCRRALDDRLHKFHATLTHHEYEDALTYLVETAWELSLRWDPEKDQAHTKGRTPTFSDYAYTILRWRVTDWYRKRYGDTRYHEKRDDLSLDHLATINGTTSAAGEHPTDVEHRLGDTLPGRHLDTPEHRSPDLARALTRRDSRRPEHAGTQSREAPGRAA